MTTEQFLEGVASRESPRRDQSPARLKAKIYSTLIARMSETGPLLSLVATEEQGQHLCVFERTLTLIPGGEKMGPMNPCRVCHARVLGERLEWAPIFWEGCPYSEFHNG